MSKKGKPIVVVTSNAAHLNPSSGKALWDASKMHAQMRQRLHCRAVDTKPTMNAMRPTPK